MGKPDVVDLGHKQGGEQHQHKEPLPGVFGLHPHIFDIYARFAAWKRQVDFMKSLDLFSVMCIISSKR